MKRKLILIATIVGIIISASLFAADAKDYNTGNKANKGNYSIRCYKCAENAKDRRGYGMCMGCNAWRTPRFEVVNGEKCMVYHCHHGHDLYVSVESNKRM